VHTVLHHVKNNNVRRTPKLDSSREREWDRAHSIVNIGSGILSPKTNREMGITVCPVFLLSLYYLWFSSSSSSSSTNWTSIKQQHWMERMSYINFCLNLCFTTAWSRSWTVERRASKATSESSCQEWAPASSALWISSHLKYYTRTGP